MQLGPQFCYFSILEFDIGMKLKMSIQRKKLRKIMLTFYFTCSNFNYKLKHFKVTELQLDRSREKIN